MSKEKKVYMVIDGDDNGRYRVEYVFTSKKEARYVQRLFHQFGRVESISFDVTPPHPRGQKPYRVLVSPVGRSLSVERIIDDYNFVRATKEECVATTWTPGLSPRLIVRDNTFISLWAKNPAEARKKAKDKFERIKKSGKLNKIRTQTEKKSLVGSGTPNSYPLAVNTPLTAEQRESK